MDLSGSPVFTNECIQINSVGKYHGQWPSAYGALVLLGLYVGAWDGRPGEILAKDRSLKGETRIPVGMGIVVPAQRILEVIREDHELKAKRQARVDAAKKSGAAVTDSAFAEPDHPGTDNNPNHREDFMRLVNEATRKREQED